MKGTQTAAPRSCAAGLPGYDHTYCSGTRRVAYFITLASQNLQAENCNGFIVWVQPRCDETVLNNTRILLKTD
jgi:hypothetical protein